MASFVPLKSKDEYGIGDVDNPEVGASDHPSSPPSTNEAFLAAADHPSPPPSTNEAFLAAADLPSPPPSANKTGMAISAHPSPPPSADEAVMAAADHPSPPPSTNEAFLAAADHPSLPPSTNEAFLAAADHPSPPPSANEAVMAVSDHPSSSPVDAFTSFTGSPSATDEVVKTTFHEGEVDLPQESSRQTEIVTSPPKREKRETENPAPTTDQQEGTFSFPFNREILESLFAVCSTKELAKFRYVSKEWSEASVKAWRKGAQVAVVDYQGKPKREYFKKMLPLNTLIAHMNDPTDELKLNFLCYNFQKYKLEGWYITNNNPNMVTFWGNVGPSITQLYLYDLRIKNMDIMLEILYGKVPNIKTLILEKLFVRRDSFSTQAERYSALPTHEKLSVLKVRHLINFPVNWREFFGHFPGVESLESFSITNDATLVAMLESINSIRMEKDILKLKSLSIIRADKRHRCVAEPVSEDLKDLLFALKDVQLEEFTLKLGCKTSITNAKVVLGTFAESLRKLTFHVDYKTRNDRHRFPYLIKFPVLEEMQLFQWCFPETKFHLLVKQMPNLRSLKVGGARKIFGDPDDFYDKALFASEDGKKTNLVFAPGLDELSLRSTVCRSTLTLTKVKYFATFAPNLTKLGFKMDDRMFRLVCKSYPNLIEMRVGGTDLTDAGVCGTKEKKENISDLKKLRVFVLESFTHDLTDVSIFNGFLKVPKLFTLQMSLPEAQISLEARQALEESINNLVIMRWPEGKKKGKQDEGTVEASDDEVYYDVEEGDK